MLRPRTDHNYVESMQCVDESFRGYLDNFCALLMGRPDRGELLGVLGKLSSALDQHFEVEERGGALSEAAAHAPSQCRKAAELLMQHPALSDDLASLSNGLRNSSASPEWWSEFVSVADTFVRKLIEHERAEREFIRGAYDPDMEPNDLYDEFAVRHGPPLAPHRKPKQFADLGLAKERRRAK